MFLLYEEDGTFRTGSVLADNVSSLQIETVSGARAKIKAVSVLLRFEKPAASALLDAAKALADDIEAEFLWECAGDGDFSFLDFARDYYGQPPSAVEATALLLALQAAPVYFHRKGKGRFKKAPADILAAALAALEKKRQQALAVERMAEALKAGTLPAEFPPLLRELLYKPDRNKPETKALEAACDETGLSAVHLLARCGAIRSAYDYHFQRFLNTHFPRGTGFPEASAVPDEVMAGLRTSLPRADVVAFSIDDAETTEIDDAFSIQVLPGVGWRVGIHIAAPALGILPGSPLDGIARERLSTVYMPGNKITMLPAAAVSCFTLEAGRDCPSVSLYLTVSPELEIVGHTSRLEIVPVVANLRHHEIEPLFNDETLTAGLADFRFGDELRLLWQLACACEGRRGKPSAIQGLNDYTFAITGDPADPETCRISINERKRGSPIDKLVSELMIVANSTWGGLLAEQGVAAIYRAQTSGKVRMTTSPLPHEGLGVPQYAWSSSPLRRYVDLINQWQLIACLQDQTPYFGGKGKSSNDALLAAMRDFDVTYTDYAEFQRGMERYWCLRWLQQEGVTSIEATVYRENLVKLDHLPLLLRVPSLPLLAPGQRIRLVIEHLDELTLELGCRHVETFQTIAPLVEEVADEGVEGALD